MRFELLIIVVIGFILFATATVDGRRYFRKPHSLRSSERENAGFPGSCAASLVSGSWVGCAVDLGKLIWSLHTWNDDQPIQRCGIDCTGNLKGRISKLEWVWDAKFQCEGRAPGIVGEGSGKKSRQGAMEAAIEAFVVAAIDAGKLKAEDFNC